MLPKRSLTKQPYPTLPDRFNRLDFGRRVRYFDKAVRNTGLDCSVATAVPCPCVISATDHGKGQPDIDCPTCLGQGFFYPVEVSTRCIVSSVNMDPRPLQPEGQRDMGTASATFPSGTRLGYWDRVYFPDMSVLARDPRKLREGSNRVWLTFRAPVIHEVWTRNPDTRQAVQLSAELGDFMLDPATCELIISREGALFYEGMPVAVVYTAAPFFYVVDMPHQFRATWVKRDQPDESLVEVPVNAVLKRADLILPTTGALPAVADDEDGGVE